MDYQKLYDKLEDLRALEKSNDSTIYHHIINSLPSLISINNIIDYHNFLINSKHITEKCDP